MFELLVLKLGITILCEVMERMIKLIQNCYIKTQIIIIIILHSIIIQFQGKQSY